MALTRRQRLCYLHTADLYAPNALVVSASKEVRSVPYGPGPTESGVRCQYIATSEMAAEDAIGRTNKDIVFTLDRFHFDAAVLIDDAWYLRLTTEGHPENGTFWVVEGGPEIVVRNAHRRANYRSVYAKRALRPPGVA